LVEGFQTKRGKTETEHNSKSCFRIMQSASKREVCYSSRDTYHKCLDTLPEDPVKECGVQKKKLDDSCPPSWVSYFQKQRDREVMLQLQVESSSSRWKSEA
jgi:hypothetical protein